MDSDEEDQKGDAVVEDRAFAYGVATMLNLDKELAGEGEGGGERGEGSSL